MLQSQTSIQLPSNPSPSARASIALGSLLVLAGILLNKWSVSQLVLRDGQAFARVSLVAVFVAQVCLILLGMWQALRRPGFTLGVAGRRLALFGLTVAVSLGGYGSSRAMFLSHRHHRLLKTFDAINASEELILSLAPQLNDLVQSVMNLELPDHRSWHLFGDAVTVRDLARNGSLSEYEQVLPTVEIGLRCWPVSQATEVCPAKELRLWRTLFDIVHYFERAQFEIQEGRFLNAARDQYETVLLFHGVARMTSGKLAAVESTQQVRWKQRSSDSEQDTNTWLIDAWHTDSFSTIETDQPPFVEVLDRVLGNPSDLARARSSRHEELVRQYFLDPENFEPPPHFSFGAMDRHPAVSVVDLDRDGFDDLYVMDQWGENMFFHNRGDGSFEEIAAQIGLNIKDHTSCAIFADFDNDGDYDVFLGRTLGRSLYLRNDNGRFVDCSESLVDVPLPYLVASVSAVDYNNDGLLDIYISTYAGHMLRQEEAKGPDYLKQRHSLLSEFLPEADARELHRLITSADSNQILNRPGPPNVLLKNVGGGRFVLATDTPELRVFRNTYQATWCDYDDDGLPDVYLSNDFSPNMLFHNEGGGRFRDVTEETGTADIGFGMGASWGDYDNDGRQDLYVTNMYSKAGRRITAQIPDLDPRFAKMASGNSLFHNVPGRFIKVSGLAPPALTVEKAGWGWGSQFVDVDNDGYLDIYALSGFYTTPKEFAKPVDI